MSHVRRNGKHHAYRDPEEWSRAGKHASIFDDTTCDDCGMETNHIKRDDDGAEFYMVKPAVWKAAEAAGGKANFLCVGCLEDRVGRPLRSSDFTDAPLNTAPDWEYGRSARLRDRLRR